MSEKVLVWDLPLRIFHWSLVISFAVAYLTEDDWITVHAWAGYVVGGLLLFRLFWGFIGNRYARFSGFICSPQISIQYLRDLMAGSAKRYIGHNPAGALMIVILLLSLLLTVLTGLAVYAADQNAGPLAGLIGSHYEDLWEESHEFLANFSVFLVCIHIIGVLLESFLHQENLARAMVHGFKDPRQDD
jgi:cytochrome b